MAQQVYFSLQSTLDEQQHDLQMYLHSNVERRQVMQDSLEQLAKKSQGIFASLMARVMSCMPSSGSKRPVDTSNDENTGGLKLKKLR